jgi:hypothetical protein
MKRLAINRAVHPCSDGIEHLHRSGVRKAAAAAAPSFDVLLPLM